MSVQQKSLPGEAGGAGSLIEAAISEAEGGPRSMPRYSDVGLDRDGNFQFCRFPVWVCERMRGKRLAVRYLYAWIVMLAVRPDGSLQTVRVGQRELQKRTGMHWEVLGRALRDLEETGLMVDCRPDRRGRGQWRLWEPPPQGLSERFVRLPLWLQEWLPLLSLGERVVLLHLTLHSLDHREGARHASVRISRRQLASETGLRREVVDRALTGLQARRAIYRNTRRPRRERSVWHVNAPQPVAGSGAKPSREAGPSPSREAGPSPSREAGPSPSREAGPTTVAGSGAKPVAGSGAKPVAGSGANDGDDPWVVLPGARVVRMSEALSGGPRAPARA